MTFINKKQQEEMYNPFVRKVKILLGDRYRLDNKLGHIVDGYPVSTQKLIQIIKELRIINKG